MRLQKLLIRRFKNLRDIELDFSDAFTSVLVGRNGTGKSNVLEALILIFRDLDLGNPPLFGYQIEYTCRGASVLVDADPDRRAQLVRILVDGVSVSREAFARKGDTHGRYLPNHVFGYYSGPSNRMEDHFATHQKQFAEALRKGNDRALRPLFYARLVHSQFALLSFFQREGQDRQLLKDPLNIEQLESVLFVLKEPHWADESRKTPEDNPGDPRFWGAQGVVRDFLRRLYALSLAPMRTQRGKRLYLYLEDREHLFELAQGYHDKGPQEFFKALESLYVSEMIESVRTRVKVGGTDEPLTFRELGEGEQQLLMVLGLLRFMEGQEALFLLDEPDTHLNPAWSLRYAQLLRDSVADEETSQIVMATHDPLVIAGLERKDVLLMQRDDVTGRVFAEHPAEDPRGMGVAGLLTSEVYGLQSDLSPEAVADLETLRRLTMLGERTEEEERELSRIYKQYHGARLTRTTRDPMFSLFVQAMRKAERTENLDKLALSPTEVHERERLAVQIAQRVKAEYNARLDKDAGDSSVADE